jgi:protein-disulfide isomerase
MCILGYGVCFLQVFYTWLIRKRFGSEKFFTALKIDILHFVGIQKISGFVIAVFLAVFMLIFFALPPYWELSPPKLTSNIPRGVTEDGHPWIGAENPYLVIIEFSDYLCFPCKKNYLHLRRIIEKYPDKIRLVHRHFPMDHRVNPIVKEPYHNGAGKLALVAIASMETGKFWEMNDVLFNVSRKKNKVNIKELSEYAGIEFEELKIGLKGSNIEIKLQKDIYAGIKLGLSGTPGFVINDKLYVGQIPGEVFRNYGIIGKKNSFMEKLLNDF